MQGKPSSPTNDSNGAELFRMRAPVDRLASPSHFEPFRVESREGLPEVSLGPTGLGMERVSMVDTEDPDSLPWPSVSIARAHRTERAHSIREYKLRSRFLGSPRR